MHFEQREALLSPETLPYQSGIERLSNGILHVGVLTRMPEISPEMISWWFGDYMQTTEHYKRWHPRDHVWMSWEDKAPGTHIGAKHCVHEYIGGTFNKLKITFLPPTEYFNESLLSKKGAVAICARSGLLDKPVDVARMVHLALPTAWGCELHSRFWLGYVHSRCK
ncbi:MAG: DAPG hydrolase family protein [Gammaproteobacteria bacterium]